MQRAARWSSALALLAGVVLAPLCAAASTRYDPRLRFRTISTARFDIHFHQGGEAPARQLAAIVETAAAEVDAAIGAALGRVQVILVDQHDLSNGWATPVPFNTIEISTAAPAAESGIGNTADWLRLVFVHEYTHIAHLSRAGGWIAALRRGFGRVPLLFPNLFQPLWGIEGMATWQESTVTHEGRVVAGDFRLLLDRAASAQRFEPLDRVSGGNVDWPSGTGPYLYGAYFHRFLAEKYGADSVRALARETSRRLPYFGFRAYRKVFGRSLGQLWADFEAASAAAQRPPSSSPAVRLTHHGFRVGTPRHAADGRLFYSALNPHTFPALMELAAAGGASRVVTTRYLGGAIGVAGDRLVLDELDFVRSVALQSDIHAVNPESGERTRLTYQARAADPDVTTDGRSVVCTIQMADRRALATFALGGGGPAEPQVLISEAGSHFAAPRWSPDGRTVVAERRQRGGLAEIVLVDVASGAVRTLARLPGGRSGAPTWMRGGLEILFSSAVADEAFGLYRVDVASGAIARLEGTGDSAQAPDVSPDGQRVVFVGYTVDGYDLFALPLAGAVWTPVAAAPPAPPHAPATVATAGPAHTYTPWRTLAPTFWTPIVEVDADEIVIGAASGSADALGRHAYGIEAGWSARRRPDWQVAYAYDRWRPTLFAAFADDTDPWRDGERRSRELDAGMLLPFRRVRDARSVLAAVHVARDQVECAECGSAGVLSERRTSLRTGVSFANSHEFGYSVSPEEGARLSATVELSRATLEAGPPPGTDGAGVALTADLRKYWRAWPRHGVVALRAAAAMSAGAGEAQQQFTASGHGPQPGGFGFGLDAIGLLRGFDEDAVIGTHAVVVNADYRFPLWRVGRGIGTVPVFLRTIHGALFADAGHAWTDTTRWGDARASAGVELSVDAVIGFVLPFTFTAGAALRHDRDGSAGAVAFGRIGRAF